MVLRSRLAGLAAVASLALAGALAAQVPASLLSKLEWRSLGPSIGGRVVAVAGVPGNPTLYYMGAVGGGIWKSTDAGTQWVNISDGKLPSISPSVGAIAVAASNPSVIYAGMGESDIRTDMIPGDGMYKSTDAGRTWTYAGLRATHTISAIAIDPKNPDVVYVSSMGHVFAPDPERGVFKTTDGGKTWSKVLFVNNQTGAIDVVMDPGHPDVLYAAMWQAQRTPYSLISGGPGSGLYKTTDGGAHWTNLTRNAGLPAGIIDPHLQGLAPTPARLLLHRHLRRSAKSQRRLRAQRRRALGLARRRQDLQPAAPAPRRQPYRLDQPAAHARPARGQRRRRHRLARRRQDLEQRAQPAHRPVLSRQPRRPVPLPRLRRAAG
jgi:photosystem II stability/assembly factor-like uncharacterized protein